MKNLTQLSCLLLVVALCGCKPDAVAEAAPTEPSAQEEPQVAPDPEPAAVAEAPPEAQAAAITVEKAGTKFEPPIKAEQVPAGSWYCAMDTVHWAASEKPEDGKCPSCGMALKQAEAEKAADEGHGHSHGHEH